MRHAVIAGVLLALGVASAAAGQPAAGDAARLRLAQALVEATGGRAQAEVAIKAMFGSLNRMTADITPGAPDLALAFQHDVEDQMFSIVPQLLEISTQAYAKELSEQELTDLLAWTRSPSGQAVARKGVAIRQDILSAETPLLRAMMPTLMQRAIDRVCQAKACTPQQREVLAKAVAKATAGAAG